MTARTFDFAFPYPSQRMPVFGRNAVATSHPLAAQAGLRMLHAGGNAIDAAIATAVTLTVVEPTGNGIGSDLFAIVWDGQELHGLNASGRSPAALTADRFTGKESMPQRGWDAVTVPGAVSGWAELSGRFGRLPFEKLFEPAIRYASEGFHITPLTARAWARSEQVFRGQAGFAQAFLPGGRAPRCSEVFRLPDQARTLEKIALSKGRDFYQGQLAEAIAEDARRNGALLTLEDLAGHSVDWTGTISTPYGGAELHEIPPNGQGIASLIALGILRHHPLQDFEPDSAEALHLQIEAMKLAFADTYRFVADAGTMEVTAAQLLDDSYLAERARLISMDEARDPGHGVPADSGTVYLTAADGEGRMVSLIQSNYMGFGSGVVIPGTGIAMQNRGAGFVLTPGHPNQVAGGKRPFHTIIPGFLTAGGQPLASFGLMGGPMQPQGHLQLVLRLLAWGQNPQSASDAPRWQVTDGLGVALEAGFPAATLDGLRTRGHELDVANQDWAFGGAQLLVRLADGGYMAASDHRKDGQAVVS
jgi:gamma-glutamyltranspeptidase/glutathione hydrolase